VERENFERRGRMDFRVRAVQTTGEQVVFEVVPDPRRYEWIEDEDGERWLFDRFNYCRIPPEMVERMASELVGGILAGGTKGPDRQLIEDADAYVKERVPLIERQLDGELPDEPDVDTSEEVLRSLLGKEVGTAFLVIDIAGSTVLADRVAPAEFERLIGTALFELSAVVPLFHGHVLKYTGDGLIAYFAQSTFIRANDFAFDCALTMRKVVYDGLNPSFTKRGLPAIDVRMGLDSGGAHTILVGSPRTKRQPDIISRTISVAAKLQALAGRGGIYVGAMLAENLHVSWRMMCEPVELPPNWDYTDSAGRPYRAFRVAG
jgi:adenylate cyclase